MDGLALEYLLEALNINMIKECVPSDSHVLELIVLCGVCYGIQGGKALNGIGIRPSVLHYHPKVHIVECSSRSSPTP